jgi:hypothetical protein
VICRSPDPDPDPEIFFIFTPAWQSGANFVGVRASQKVPKVIFGYNRTQLTLFEFLHSPEKTSSLDPIQTLKQIANQEKF